MNHPQFDSGVIDAVVFDVIGTLVDEDGTWAEVARKLAAETAIDRPDALHTQWVRFLNERMDEVVTGNASWQRHSDLVIESAEAAVTALGGTPTAAMTALLSTLDSEYPAWPEVAAATAALRRDRLVAGVSNGDLDSLARLANANRISWDVALSTGTAHTFKPAPAAYQYAIDTLRLAPERTLFVAAHPWDLRAAAEFGFRTAYVARPDAERPSREDHFDLSVDNLAELAGLLT
jgi:2-haloacid dehalogenase